MSPAIYHYLHLVGVLLLFTSVGLMLAVASGVPGAKKTAGMLHGIGLVILLVAGFGFLAKAKLAMGGWVWAKVVIWLLLGGLPALVSKGKLKPGAGMTVALLLGAAAAYIGYFKPF